MAVTLARFTWKNRSNLPKDAAVNNWVFSSDDLSATTIGAIEARLVLFYSQIASHMSPCLSTATGAWVIQLYDITGSGLTGAPHGSPYATDALELVSAVDSGNPIPNEVAICMGFFDAGITGLFEHGTTSTEPSTEAAIDQGAPATHSGVSHPRARHRGRLYLGPLGSSSLEPDANGNPMVNHTVVGQFVGAAQVLRDTAPGTTHVQWCVWSRRNATALPVVHGWVDNRLASVRRRQPVATSRALI